MSYFCSFESVCHLRLAVVVVVDLVGAYPGGDTMDESSLRMPILGEASSRALGMDQTQQRTAVLLDTNGSKNAAPGELAVLETTWKMSPIQADQITIATGNAVQTGKQGRPEHP